MHRHATLKLVLRLALICAVVLGVAGYTLASWSDSATSTGNVYATGNLDLKVRPLGSLTWVQGPLSGTWHAEGMYPGQELEAGGLYFKNAGTIVGRTLDIRVTNVCSVPGMDQYIQITEMEYENGTSHNMLNPSDPFRLHDLNGNGWIDLDDLENDPCLCLPAPDTAGALTMDYRFNENAGNEYKGGQSVTAEFTFTLHQ